MHLEIIPLAPEHIENFHKILDSVAREKRSLLFIEALTLENFTAR